MPIFSIAFVLLLSCSVVTPPNLLKLFGGVTSTRQVPFTAAIVVASTCYAIPMGTTQSKSLNMVLM
jgi:hypothetical protein